MDRQALIELQKIDCNCNDCIFMVRDQERFKESLADHQRWQQDYFNTKKQNLLNKAAEYEDPTKYKYNLDKARSLRAEANRMRFQFDKKEASINYGDCTKLKKPVSFIPNTCQIKTQECFKHRRE